VAGEGELRSLYGEFYYLNATIYPLIRKLIA
jgi:hypothetical protein